MLLLPYSSSFLLPSFIKLSAAAMQVIANACFEPGMGSVYVATRAAVRPGAQLTACSQLKAARDWQALSDWLEVAQIARLGLAAF